MSQTPSKSESMTGEVRETAFEPFLATALPGFPTFATSITLRPDGTQDSRNDACFMIELLNQEDGGYVVLVPSLPGASTQGTSLENAIQMVRESIKGMVAVAEPADYVLPDLQEFEGRGVMALISVPLDETTSQPQAA